MSTTAIQQRRRPWASVQLRSDGHDMIDLHLGDDEAEFRCFTSALSTIFRDEPWEVVEQHARRAWISADFGGGTPWEDVVERIRADWPCTES